MISFTPHNELMKGLSDIPIAVFCLTAAILLLKNKKQKKDCWGLMFLFVSVAAFLGAFVHSVVIGNTLLKIIWIPLYCLMYESSRICHIRFIGIYDYNYPSLAVSRILSIFEIVFCFVSCLALLLGYTFSIYVFLFYSLSLILPFLGKLIVKKNMLSLFLFLSLLLSIIFQIFKDFFPPAVVIAHIFLLIGTIFIYFIATEDEKKNENRFS